MYIPRILEETVFEALKNNPVVAITGPRQCGKSTLAKQIRKKYATSICLDLERPSDLLKLEDAEWFLSTQKGKLICIDEIQRMPELFPLIRSLTDEWNISGAFLILGSASRMLLKQSSESLAGRISYKNLTPFLWKEVNDRFSLETCFSRGAFPRSLLAAEGQTSFQWLEDFITTFLERDLIQWKNFTPFTMRRLWQMLAHLNGQTVNYSSLGNSLGVSNSTVKNYIDLLQGTFMVDVVPPYISNLGKRLIKAPKVYISDSGITAALLGLHSFEEMAGHPSFGAIWEQIVLTNLRGVFPEADFYYYRTGNGAEMDFVMRLRNKVFALECKTAYAPRLTKGNFNAFNDIAPEKMFVVAPVKKGWPMRQKIEVVSLSDIEDGIRNCL